MKKKCTAIILSAGRGKRMESNIPKQYLLIKEKPVLFYSLKAFEDSFIDNIILVTAQEDISYCRREIVKKYGFHKVSHIIAGGKERYHSVNEGIKAADKCDYLFIHDGARPFVTQSIIEEAYEGVTAYDACVIGVPVKDTIRITDNNQFAQSTPKRNQVWAMQTPQVFSYVLIKEAYALLINKEKEIIKQGIIITDDAMVVETFTDRKIKLKEGSYTNIKITTPEDLALAEAFLEQIY